MKKRFSAALTGVALGLALLISGHSDAADLARKPVLKAPPAAIAAWTWTGFYVGGHLGAGWGDKWWDSTGAYPFSSLISPEVVGQNFGTTSVDGFLGGAQVGFNYQSGLLVWGVEADASWTDMKGKFACPPLTGVPAFATCSSRIDWVGTLTGRVGVPIDHALVYVGGGAAWSHEKDHLDCTDRDCGNPFSAVFTWDGQKTKWGWTFLTGVEYAIDNHWSAKLQYNYYQFDDGNVTLTPNQTGCFAGGCTAFDVTTPLRIHTIKAGLNYRFDWGSPAVRAMAFADADPKAAYAADLRMPVKAPPLVRQAWSWTGLYIGGHIGAGWGDKWWDSTGQNIFNPSVAAQDVGQNIGTTSVEGFLGGGQIGFNYQTGLLVFGVEADASWSNIKGKFACPAINGRQFTVTFSTCSSRVDWLGTVVGRVGVTVDRALVYAGGGAAWSHEKDHLDCTDFDCGSPFTSVYTFDGASTKWGWTFLAGVEYAIDPHWSAKIQYNYYEFADGNVQLTPNQTTGCNNPGGCLPLDVTTQLRMHTLKAGLNYRFDWGGPRTASAIQLPAPVQVSWGGFYVGGHVGAGWGNKWWDSTGYDPFNSPLAVQDIGQSLGTTSVDGFLGGGQVGFNYQTGRLVFGVEADASATGLKGKFPCAVIAAGFDLSTLFTTCSSKVDWIGTVVGRVGVTVDRALVYAGAGGAWAHEKDRLECTDGDCAINPLAIFAWDGANTKWGWTFLAGTEYAIDRHWSAKLQYNFYDFADGTATLVPNQTAGCVGGGCAAFDVNTRLRMHTIKAGLNYKFDWGGPVAARY